MDYRPRTWESAQRLHDAYRLLRDVAGQGAAVGSIVVPLALEHLASRAFLSVGVLPRVAVLVVAVEV